MLKKNQFLEKKNQDFELPIVIFNINIRIFSQ